MRAAVLLALAMLVCGTQAHTYYEVAKDQASSSFSTSGGNFSAYTHTYTVEGGTHFVTDLTLPAGATGAALVASTNGSYADTALVLVAPLDAPLSASKEFLGNFSDADLLPSAGTDDIAEFGEMVEMGDYFLVANTTSGPIYAVVSARAPLEGHGSLSAYAPGPAPEGPVVDDPSTDLRRVSGANEAQAPAAEVAQQALTSAAMPAAGSQASALVAALLAALALLA